MEFFKKLIIVAVFFTVFLGLPILTGCWYFFSFSVACFICAYLMD